MTIDRNLDATSSGEADARTEREQAIVLWLREYLADLLPLPLDQVNPATSFGRYGLDSSAIVGMTGDLGEWLGVEVDPAAAYDHPTIAELARAVCADLRAIDAHPRTTLSGALR